jgi:hypothetical protein
MSIWIGLSAVRKTILVCLTQSKALFYDIRVSMGKARPGGPGA